MYKMCAIRWKVEEFHRELKQLTGIRGPSHRAVKLENSKKSRCLRRRNMWARLKSLVYQTGQTIYQVKHGLLFKLFN